MYPRSVLSLRDLVAMCSSPIDDFLIDPDSGLVFRRTIWELVTYRSRSVKTRDLETGETTFYSHSGCQQV